MARRRLATRKFFEKYPGVYARTTDVWTTRYYQRKNDPQFKLLGLCTAPDDFDKKEGSSPYLRNVRYMGEREADQRAQVMSRRGAGFLGSLGDDVFTRLETDGQTYLEIHEGKAMQWNFFHNKKLAGVSFHLFNVDKATGYIKITVRDADTKQELANAVVNSDLISTRGYSFHAVRFIKAITKSRVIMRMEVLDDVDNSECADVMRDKRTIRVLARVDGSHETAYYDLPNNNDCLHEIPYVFSTANCIPLMGSTINDWSTLPSSIEFRSGGRNYIAFVVKHDGIVELYKADVITKEITLLTNRVDARATTVRFDKAEGYLYYVDGYSPLRRISQTTLVSEDVVPLQADITIPGVNPATLTAKAGASLIHFLNNRLYLAGFLDDPNLVLVSLIDSVKPRFEQYNDRFYSPDQSPELSAGSPITALADISDYIIVWRLDGLSLFSAASGFDDATASQTTPEGAALGVLNQEAVCQGKNNIYFFNPIEGVCRFAGSVNRSVSGDIENLFKQIKNKDKIFMVYQNKRVRMYFSFDDVVPDSCLYYYTELEGRLPWYLDNNTPVISAVPSKVSEQVIGIHSQIPAIMDIDAGPTDFDSYIEMEYHTQYRIPPTVDASGWAYIKRLHIHEIAASTHSLYIGLDIDHQDQPIVWRRYIEATVDEAANPDAVFGHTAEPGNAVIDIAMYVKCRRYQVRLKRYCYKDAAEVLGIGVEYGNKDSI